VAKPVRETTQYVLQVASLKNSDDAEELKAKLLLMGYDVAIESQKESGSKWIRVTVGSYERRTLAEKDQRLLKKAGIDSFVRNA